MTLEEKDALLAELDDIKTRRPDLRENYVRSIVDITDADVRCWDTDFNIIRVVIGDDTTGSIALRLDPLTAHRLFDGLADALQDLP